MGPGRNGIGSLLDHWSTSEFDPQTRTLSLRTYRPTGEPYQDEGQTVCEVEEKWMGMRLAL